MVVFAILLLAVVLFYPRGIMGNEELTWARLKRLSIKPLAVLKEVKK
jgi:hypothetical protein